MQKNINLMKADVASTNELVKNMSKFTVHDQAASQEPISARGDKSIPIPLPNKLAINF